MIKRLRLLIIWLTVWNVAAAPVARASFDDMGAGARAPGMADAFTAVSDNADASMYNPAGLVQTTDGSLTSEYGQLFKGLDDGSAIGATYLGYAHPLRQGKKGVLGLVYHNFKAANLLTERTLAIAYGWKLQNDPFGLPGNWSLGGTLKQLHRQYQPDRFTENALNDTGTGTGQADPLFAKNGYASDAYGLDLGALYQFGPKDKYSAGVTLRNVNQPDVSIGGDGDKAPMSVKVGAAVRPKWGLLSAELRRVNRLSGSPDTEMAVGAERRFTLKDDNAFVMRGGYASGSREYKVISAGAAYQLGRAIFDYAFSFPVGALAETDGSHRVGFSYRLGAGKDEAAVPVVIPTPEAEAVPTPSATPEAQATPAATPLPDAPTALTAPVPVYQTTGTAVANEFDDKIKNFGTLLGYYVSRTTAGAPVEERRAILKEIKRLFGASGIDMTYVNDELKSVGEETIPKSSVAPATKPAMKVVPLPETPKPVKPATVKPSDVKPAAKPATKAAPSGAMSPDMERAWNYYRSAVERGITDSERIELL